MLTVEEEETGSDEIEFKLALRGIEVRDRLLTLVLHQSRTSLNSMVGLTTLIQQALVSGDLARGQRLVAQIREEAQAALAQTGQVVSQLAGLKHDTSVFGPVKCPAMLSSILAHRQEVIRERRLTLHRRYDSDVETVASDPLLLQLILSHLMDQALRVACPGSSLDIDAKQREGRLLVQIICHRVAKVEPVDIPLNQMGRDFLEAQAGKLLTRPFGESGREFLLSLPLEFQSTRFDESSLPQAQASSTPTSSKQEATEQPDLRPTILLIEDDDFNRTVISTLLQEEEAHYRFFVVSRIEQGLSLARRYGKPGIVLFGLRTGREDLAEALRKMRTNPLLELTPLVGMIPSFRFGSREILDQFRFDYLLTKPVRRNELLSLLEEHFGGTEAGPQAHHPSTGDRTP